MARDEKESVKEQERPAARNDPSASLMARLGQVEEALRYSDQSLRAGLPGDIGAIRLTELSSEERVTPATWEDVALHGGKHKIPGHVVALVTACALIDACLLACPGTHKENAQELAGRLLDEQWEHGMFHLRQGDDPAEHMPEWDAAMAAILYTANKAPLPAIEERVAGWWRQRMETVSGSMLDLFITKGERFAEAPLAARFFYLMENVPLPKPHRPWKVVV